MQKISLRLALLALPLCLAAGTAQAGKDRPPPLAWARSRPIFVARV